MGVGATRAPLSGSHPTVTNVSITTASHAAAVTRVAIDFTPFRLNEGQPQATPVGSKCRTLRVATVRPRSSAVAAIRRSALS